MRIHSSISELETDLNECISFREKELKLAEEKLKEIKATQIKAE